MLLTQENLIDRLHKLAMEAEAIDLATAWSSPGEAQRAVLNSPGKLRAIVGIAGCATHPSVLRDFHKAGHLRIPIQAPLFHAKMILFHKVGRTTAWIGSANLTRGGYETNREIMLEYEDDGAALNWFNSIWETLDQDPSAQIDRYESGWTPGRLFIDPAVTSEHDREMQLSSYDTLLSSLDDWKSFVRAIRIANEYWKANSHWSVDGEFVSWLNTVKLGHSIMSRNDFSDISYLDYRVLMGIQLKHEESGYGLLGSMIGAGDAKKIFHIANLETLAKRRKIQRLLQPVVASSIADFPEACSTFIQEVSKIAGISGSVATRFITLARPDLGVSVNQGSVKKLSAYSGLPQGTLNKARRPRQKGSYAELIEFLQTQPWYRAPEPKDRYERSLAQSRGALLDALVYEPV